MLGMFRWATLIAAVVFVLALAGAILSSQKPIEPSEPQTSEDSYKEPDAKKNEVALFDRWFPDSTAVFNLFLMVFTGVLAFGGLIQLNLLTRAERIATETAKAAKDSAEVAKQTLIATNRAWVAVPFMGLASLLENGLPISINARLANVGKEPALGLIWSMKPRLVDYIPDTTGPKLESTNAPNIGCEDLHPDVRTGVVLWPETDTHIWVPETFAQTPENKLIFDAVLARTKSLVIDGCVAYVTAGQSHKTWFRFLLRDTAGPSKDWRFNVELSGNGAD
jgi:hypothetical protein